MTGQKPAVSKKPETARVSDWQSFGSTAGTSLQKKTTTQTSGYSTQQSYAYTTTTSSEMTGWIDGILNTNALCITHLLSVGVIIVN